MSWQEDQNDLEHSEELRLEDLEDDGMRNVLSWEHRSNNSGEYIAAHLECGHERTFTGGRPIGKGQVRCWVCDRQAGAR